MRRVLVADDDPAICTLIEMALRDESYETVARNDAESALAALHDEGPFDVLICDFMLPGATGIDLIERLRGDERTAVLPVVMMSGHANYVVDDRARGAGADVFLTKPFSLSQLRAAVNGLFRSRGTNVSRIRP